jgi:hypothetical protein
VGVRWPKQTLTGIRPSANSPQLARLMLVPSNSRGMNITPVLMELTHPSGMPQVSSSLTTAMVAMAITARVSSSSHQGTEPLLKMARFRALLWVSSRNVSGAACSLFFGSSYVCSYIQRGDFLVAQVVPLQLRSSVSWLRARHHARTRFWWCHWLRAWVTLLKSPRSLCSRQS